MLIKKVVSQAIKKAFTTALVLQHFVLDKECTIKTNASDYVSDVVLSQPDYESIFQLVVFMSYQHLSTKCNYEIYDKELLAIVRAFEEW